MTKHNLDFLIAEVNLRGPIRSEKQIKEWFWRARTLERRKLKEIEQKIIPKDLKLLNKRFEKNPIPDSSKLAEILRSIKGKIKIQSKVKSKFEKNGPYRPAIR